MVLHLSLPSTWNLHLHPRPQLLPLCNLSKQGHRLLSSLDAASGDPTTTHRLLHKFVCSSSKSTTLNAFSHLLSTNLHRHSSLALPMYERISEASWFNWNPKLVSNLIASLEKQGEFDKAEALIQEAVRKLGFRRRELVGFYCDLIDSFSKHGSKRGVFDAYSRVKKVLSFSLSRNVFESMVNGLCALGLVYDAEKMMEEMKNAGFKPSGFEFRSILLGHGRLGEFGDMRRVVEEMEGLGFSLDTISSNVVLSAYGAHGELGEMVSWIRKMKRENVTFSVRTYNSVLNSCPTVMALLEDLKVIPLSMGELREKLDGEEGLLVEELMESSVLVENLDWSSKEGKLDLHGMHLGTVYVMILRWMEELRGRFLDGDSIVVPEEIILVCGLGKHSSVRGESPVKALVAEMMLRLGSPMRIERKKGGSFVAKGRSVANWLDSLN